MPHLLVLLIVTFLCSCATPSGIRSAPEDFKLGKQASHEQRRRQSLQRRQKIHASTAHQAERIARPATAPSGQQPGPYNTTLAAQLAFDCKSFLARDEYTSGHLDNEFNHQRCIREQEQLRRKIQNQELCLYRDLMLATYDFKAQAFPTIERTTYTEPEPRGAAHPFLAGTRAEDQFFFMLATGDQTPYTEPTRTGQLQVEDLELAEQLRTEARPVRLQCVVQVQGYWSAPSQITPLQGPRGGVVVQEKACRVVAGLQPLLYLDQHEEAFESCQ